MKIIINGRVFSGSRLRDKEFSADLNDIEDFAFISDMVKTIDHWYWLPVLVIDGEYRVAGQFRIARASRDDFHSRSEFTIRIEKDFRYE